MKLSANHSPPTGGFIQKMVSKSYSGCKHNGVEYRLMVQLSL